MIEDDFDATTADDGGGGQRAAEVERTSVYSSFDSDHEEARVLSLEAQVARMRKRAQLTTKQHALQQELTMLHGVVKGEATVHVPESTTTATTAEPVVLSPANLAPRLAPVPSTPTPGDRPAESAVVVSRVLLERPSAHLSSVLVDGGAWRYPFTVGTPVAAAAAAAHQDPSPAGSTSSSSRPSTSEDSPAFRVGGQRIMLQLPPMSDEDHGGDR
jgi:hypothetical protein